jgi:HSP20 family molecular chaperone IbpA
MVDLKMSGPARADEVCALLITADLPGVDDKDMEVTVSGDALTIKCEKQVQHEEKGDEGVYRERKRSIALTFNQTALRAEGGGD